VTTHGDYEVTFQLKRTQPAFIALLASGFSPIYPCHVSPRDMRTNPIGTGPFKFVEFKPNESIKVARNPDYWKKGRPYLDGIEYQIIKNVSTGVLALVAGHGKAIISRAEFESVRRDRTSQSRNTEVRLTHRWRKQS
jgi:peptide/nickel transport system substrate-binding protein